MFPVTVDGHELALQIRSKVNGSCICGARRRRRALDPVATGRHDTTFTASNASEAIATLEENSSITVVFTDIQVPGTMDGIALARYVRKRWPPTIIVVSSGKVRPGAGELSDDIAFLPKPYDDQRLAAVIGDVRQRLAGT